MKYILRVLALCLLLAIPACALAADNVSCYWQLEAIEVGNSVSNAYGPALAETDAAAVQQSDPAAMTTPSSPAACFASTRPSRSVSAGIATPV